MLEFLFGKSAYLQLLLSLFSLLLLLLLLLLFLLLLLLLLLLMLLLLILLLLMLLFLLLQIYPPMGCRLFRLPTFWLVWTFQCWLIVEAL